jgi:hypothetical protein
MNIIRIEEKAPPNEKKEEDKIGVAAPEDDDPSKRKFLIQSEKCGQETSQLQSPRRGYIHISLFMEILKT